MSIIKDEDRYRILKLLAENADMNQRQLAAELGISLGKINYCMKALIDKGLVKANNFRRNPNKEAYVYLLTAKGIEEKACVTLRFLERKQEEYEALQKEIEALRVEAAQLSNSKKPG
jgi:EPS-associated MarR family transcriptional regulator